MRKHSFWIPGALLLAFLAGCGPAQLPAPATSEATAVSVTAPADPALPPKPTVALATQPAATSMPTAAPTATYGQTSVSVPPTTTTTSTALLLADTIWVQAANVVLPLADSSMPLDFARRGYPTPVYSPKAAPNGAYIAYGTEQGGLALVNVQTGVRRTLVEDGNGVAGFSFSPDERALAATTIAGNAWTLQVFELEQNGARVLRTGSTVAADANSLPLLPSPIAWTSAGLLVQYILYASDAPPQNPTLLNPSNPSDTTDQRIYEGAMIDAFPSADGMRFAIVTGELPIGGVPTAQISVIDGNGKQLAMIRNLQPGLLRALRWSPDGSTLVYALSANYETPNVTLRLVRADGSNGQELDLAAAGISGAFRDIAWRDNATVLLLTEGQQLQLDALPTNNFSVAARQPLRTFEGQQPGKGNGKILYVPR